MTSHDALIQTISHLYDFLKKRAKVLLFSHIHKHLCKKVLIFAIL